MEIYQASLFRIRSWEIAGIYQYLNALVFSGVRSIPAHGSAMIGCGGSNCRTVHNVPETEKLSGGRIPRICCGASECLHKKMHYNDIEDHHVIW
jgi:hypothetical protein